MVNVWVFLLSSLAVAIAEEVDYHAHPKYSFEYGVNDPHTHDVKKQWETRDGDKVQGSYSVKEADGTVRIVDYHANDHTGFNAVVRREGHAVHPHVPVHVRVPLHPESHERTHAVVHEKTRTVVHPEVTIHENTHTVVHPEVAVHTTQTLVQPEGVHETVHKIDHHEPALHHPHIAEVAVTTA